MNPRDFDNAKSGRVIKAPTGYYAFIPGAIPRELDYQAEVVRVLSLADRKMGNLEGLCRRLPNPYLLSGAYIRREAVLSSRIEGTQSTQSELYLFEMDPAEGPHTEDIKEVRNYVSALVYALKRRKELPLSLRFIREIHGELVQGVRGQEKTPGEFRISQNWIGGSGPENAHYVPPPIEEMKVLLDDFEKFLHRADIDQIPPLIECALIHYQFEAIHPFLDGNGRVGRLLITLLAIERECLSEPLLYLSAFFEKKRDEYYDQLYYVSQTGELDRWLVFFLSGVAQQAEDAIWRAGQVLDLYSRYKHLGLTPTANRIIEILFQNPYITIKSAASSLDVSHPAAASAILKLEELGVLLPVLEGRRRGQVFVAGELLDVFVTEIHADLESGNQESKNFS